MKKGGFGLRGYKIPFSLLVPDGILTYLIKELFCQIKVYGSRSKYQEQ